MRLGKGQLSVNFPAFILIIEISEGLFTELES